MPEMTLIEAVRETLRSEMHRDPDIFMMGEDIGLRGGVFLATEGFIEEFGEDRVMNTPLAESSIIGIALGAAVNGMRPVAEIQFADFVWPAINQLVGEAARGQVRNERREDSADDGASALWWGSARRSVPFAEHRGAVCAYAGLAGRRSGDAV